MKWQTAIVFIICLVVSAQHAHGGCEHSYVNVYPSGTITTQESIVLEVFIITGSGPAFLFAPTEVTWEDNEVVVNIHVSSGLLGVIESIVERVPLGSLAAGVYRYTVIVDRGYGEPASVTGTLTVTAEERPDRCEHLYWGDARTNSLKRSDLDGEQRQIVAPFIVSGIAIDSENQKIYFTKDQSKQVLRSNFDGSNQEVLVPALPYQPRSITLDKVNNLMYWTRGGGNGAIIRARLDGTNMEPVISDGLSSPEAISVDPVEEKLYWTELHGIRRANQDGSQIEDVLTDQGHFHGLALDTVNRKIYWSEETVWGNRIRRADFEGAGVEDVVPEGAARSGIAIDQAGGKIYWVHGNSAFYCPVQTIRRANLDGTQPEVVVDGLVRVSDLALYLPEDFDEDGSVGTCDSCPMSDLTETVWIGACESGVINSILDDGCTMTDQIDRCAEDSPNHGRFVSCVTRLTRNWRMNGLISNKESARLVQCTHSLKHMPHPRRRD